MEPGLPSLARRVRAIFGVYYAMMVEYRAELALWAVATSIPLIMMGVWTQVLAPADGAGDASAAAGGLDRVTIVRYFLAAFLVRQVTVVWVVYDFEWHVVSGRLSPLLLQPANPHWRFVTAHFSEQAAKLPFAVAILALCFWLYPEALWGIDAAAADNGDPHDAAHFHGWLPGVGQWAGFAFFCAWAFAVRYLMQNLVATLAFWVERVVAMEALVFLPYLYLSGLVAPLETFPDWIRDLALLTPFPYAVWVPAMLLVGGDHARSLPLLQGLLILTGWTLALAFANRLLWQRGLKHYSAMGA